MAATFFIQPCPTCGRNLNVRIQDLGLSVVCSHCRAEFTAIDREAQPVAENEHDVLAKANQLLDGIKPVYRPMGRVS